MPRGATHLAELIIERTDGFHEEITLDMAGNQSRHRQGIFGPAMKVAGGTDKIEYPVFPPDFDVVPSPWSSIMDKAVMGDATAASADKGKLMIEHVVDTIVGLLSNGEING